MLNINEIYNCVVCIVNNNFLDDDIVKIWTIFIKFDFRSHEEFETQYLQQFDNKISDLKNKNCDCKNEIDKLNSQRNMLTKIDIFQYFNSDIDLKCIDGKYTCIVQKYLKKMTKYIGNISSILSKLVDEIHMHYCDINMNNQCDCNYKVSENDYIPNCVTHLVYGCDGEYDCLKCKCSGKKKKYDDDGTFFECKCYDNYMSRRNVFF